MAEERSAFSYRDLPVPPGFVEYNPYAWRPHHVYGGRPTGPAVADHERRALSLRALSQDLSALAQLPPDGLWKLVCRRQAVTDDQFDAVVRFSLIEELDLSYTRITDRTAAAMHTMQRLRILSLDGCAVTDAAMQHVAGLRALEHLNIAKTGITDAGLGALAFHPNICVLNVRDSRVTCEALAPLLTMPRLRQMSMNHKQHHHAGRFAHERPEVEILY